MDYNKLIKDSEKLNLKEFAALLQEHSDRYHNNDTSKNASDNFQIIPDRVYDLLVEKYEERFGTFVPAGVPLGKTITVVSELRDEDEDSDQDSDQNSNSDS